MENNKVCLIVIFNHRYDKNLKLLSRLYDNRFKNIYYLVPFYNGNVKNVIPVYESSYQFQGYIAQAYKNFNNDEFSHYIFIGDDLILDPNLNESNILEHLSVKEGDAYIESLTKLNETHYWNYERFNDANQAFLQRGVNYKVEIPNLESALNKAKEFGFSDLTTKKVTYVKHNWKRIRSNLNVLYNKIVNPVKIEYPLLTGYSDFFIIPKKTISEFCRLSGVFAAMGLFVEISVPTSIMLLMEQEHVKTQKDTSLLTPKLWWITETATSFEKKCSYYIENMDKYWPENYAYLHPIKLSRWKENK